MFHTFYNSTGTIRIKVTNEFGEGVIGATSTITLTDAAGTEVTGSVWPATMYDADDGVYEYTIANTLLSNNTIYRAVINVDAGGSYRHAVVKFKVVTDDD